MNDVGWLSLFWIRGMLILLYCVDPSGRPMLGPPREGPETEKFLRTAHQDIPLVVPAIREFGMQNGCGKRTVKADDRAVLASVTMR